MTPQEIAAVLKDTVSWHQAEPHCRGAFAVEMRNRQYGHDALTQAWGWFLAGWNARHDD